MTLETMADTVEKKLQDLKKVGEIATQSIDEATAFRNKAAESAYANAVSNTEELEKQLKDAR